MVCFENRVSTARRMAIPFMTGECLSSPSLGTRSNLVNLCHHRSKYQRLLLLDPSPVIGENTPRHQRTTTSVSPTTAHSSKCDAFSPP